MNQLPSNPVIPSGSRNLLFPSLCNISVTINKSLRQISNQRYNRAVDNRVQAQAPTVAPLFLPELPLAPNEYATFLDPGAPASLIFSATCTLSKTCHLQPAHYKPLAHSLKNIGGYGVVRSNPTLPISEPPPCNRDRLPDRGPFAKILAPTRRPNSQSATPNRRSRPNQPASPAPFRFSLAIKKQSIPN
jgi:hypothetical protein